MPPAVCVHPAAGGSLLRGALAAALALAAAAAQNAPAPLVLDGRVVDVLGDPIPAASVRLLAGLEAGDALATARTDGDGMFQLRARVDRGVVTIAAPGRETYLTRLEFCSGHVITTLHDAADLECVVLDEAGSPLAGADVIVLGASYPADPALEARSGADGHARIRGVPLGRARVTATAPGRACVGVLAWHDGRTPAQFALPPAPSHALTVQCAGLTAEELASTRIEVQTLRGPLTFNLPAALRTHRLPRGEDRLRAHLPAGHYAIDALVPGLAGLQREVEIRDGDAEVSFAFAAGPPRRVEGRVVRADGTGLAHAELLVRAVAGRESARTTTGSDGRFACTCRTGADDRVALQLVDSDDVLEEPDVGAVGKVTRRLDQPLLLRSRPGAGLQCQVLTHDGARAPLACLQLRRVGKQPPPHESLAFVQADLQGRAFVRGRVEFDDEVYLDANDGYGSSQPVRLVAGAMPELPPLQLVAPSVVEGTVHDASGRPVVGAECSLGLGTACVARTTTDRSGHYRFRLVHRGTLELSVLGGEASRVVLEPGRTAIADVTATPPRHERL